ncbi:MULTISPECIES: pyridoxamine 5'-phosphate oxidase family protein [unclassified Streptomyces]|uniref:helix-turn-helix domain-containing protein n=1 Tax=unclassified Streptomyces TaxID=2593676 RepID=UPI002259A9B1|nr:MULTISPECIES: pyridoxamine 5'-phosphate oxidase family protein [unclassified Streptomyces]MCX5336617.1 pyridoxamine 5'-phosphate oxidase family protein [Streptomyces sp. NBC_00140]MCX5367521.1 pyridoxamine 5'-phosphate oxidase family protein [Streptomyces sp. NBC_00124]
MSERTRPDAGTTAERPLGDLGRRLATRRAQLGLTRQEAATRAGMAPGYLKHLEEHPGAAPNRGTLLSLAAALLTTMAELTGGADDLPPGLEQASRSPELTELSTDECGSLLGTHGVGRIAVTTASGPVILPVNYSVVDGTIVFRTNSGATPSLASGQQVAFEVDRIDDAFSSGWSVLVRGPARTVTDADEARRLDEQAYSAPWAGGRRDLWVRIESHTVTGRRIAV